MTPPESGRRRLASATLGLLVVMACRGGEPRPDTSATVPDTGAATATRQAPVLSTTGIAAVRIGTTLDSAWRAAGEPAAPPDTLNAECAYVRLTALPQGVALMIIEGRVVRIDVEAAGISTAEGARIGDTETSVDSLYGPRVRREPHKYVDGSYLIVPSPADTTRQLVFETDGRLVTAIRAGLTPMVRWVEGCS